MTLANFLNYEFKVNFIGERVNRRINRSRYILYSSLLGFLPLLLGFILGLLMDFLLPPDVNSNFDDIFGYIGLFIFLGGIVLNFILFIKRLHDINLLGWLILLVFFFPLIFYFFCMLLSHQVHQERIIMVRLHFLLKNGKSF